MEDEFENPEDGINVAEYEKGFNQAFVVAEANPTLAKDIFSSLELDSDFASGLFHGSREFFRQQELDRAKELDSLRNRGNDMERGR
ncbi:MAG: hypothetical protein K9J17_02475 [Flavobacteriales bacterium]|nr:hypothetical protein [Flavobacteriales bacterium]